MSTPTHTDACRCDDCMIVRRLRETAREAVKPLRVPLFELAKKGRA